VCVCVGECLMDIKEEFDGACDHDYNNNGGEREVIA